MDAIWPFVILFLTGSIAGFVDSIAGGGGLITLPVLLSMGFSPQDALGTNKLQATFGSGSATWHFAQAGWVDFRASAAGILFTAIGAVIGTVAVQSVDPTFLRRGIPWLLTAIALYTLLQPRLGEKDIMARLDAGLFHAVFGLLLGFYDGFFGPGTGSFWAMAYMMGLGFNMTRATAHTKAMNLTSNLGSLLIFLAGQHVIFFAGLTMGLGQLLGARLGARTVIRNGTRLVRPIFIAMVLAITLKLFYENYFNR